MDQVGTEFMGCFHAKEKRREQNDVVGVLERSCMIMYFLLFLIYSPPPPSSSCVCFQVFFSFPFLKLCVYEIESNITSLSFNTSLHAHALELV